MKVSDLVICRGKEFGIIIELDEDNWVDSKSFIWAKVMWSNGRITWEDIILSTEDKIFEVVKYCSRPTRANKANPKYNISEPTKEEE